MQSRNENCDARCEGIQTDRYCIHMFSCFHLSECRACSPCRRLFSIKPPSPMHRFCLNPRCSIHPPNNVTSFPRHVRIITSMNLIISEYTSKSSQLIGSITSQWVDDSPLKHPPVRCPGKKKQSKELHIIETDPHCIVDISPVVVKITGVQLQKVA